MKPLVALVVLLLAAVASSASSGSSLLEMSQVLWSRVLDGGYHKVGRLDPLYVPVVKVDQSEGNTSYRVLLRNLEVSGLNASRIESVHIARGKLNSSLSEGEAGYVSYNEQKGIDSIRYRFHTVVKEPRRSDDDSASETEQFERVIEYDPTFVRAQQEDSDLFTSERYGQAQRRYYAEATAANSKDGQRQQTFNGASQSNYGDMRVVLNPTPRSPSSVRVVYSSNYPDNKNPSAQVQNENARPCVGACKNNQGFIGRVETRRYQGPFPAEDNARAQTRAYQDQQYYSSTGPSTTPGYGLRAQFGDSSFSAQGSNGQQGPTQFAFKGGNNFGVNYSSGTKNGPFPPEGQNVRYGPPQDQFSVKGGSNAGANYQANYNGRVSVEGQTGQYGQPQNQFSVKGGNSGVSYSGNYGTKNAQVSVENNGGEYYGPNGQRQNQFSVKGGSVSRDQAPGNYEAKAQFGGSGFEGGIKGGSNSGFYSGGVKNGQFSVQGQSGNRDNSGFSFNYGSNENFKGSTAQPSSVSGDYSHVKFQPTQRTRYSEQTTASYVEEFEPYKAPLVRVEKQPGYIDIVYASPKNQGNRPRFENLKVAPANDPRASAYENTKESRGDEKYVRYNLTEGESLNKRYNAARVVVDTRRIEDLARYASDYQEKQGYFEEGMELIYHFGNANNTARTNETLIRRKRQHDKEDEDVMHVIVRIRVPRLSVKSGYSLMGKVGKQLVRGNGLLSGNFTDVVADFTVELKQVDNRTMIVRAARAKLVSTGNEIKLEGMNEKGPVKAILLHGVMAAEAVAAMVADDLATKTLNEGNTDATVYKMYKNLPVPEKA